MNSKQIFTKQDRVFKLWHLSLSTISSHFGKTT